MDVARLEDWCQARFLDQKFVAICRIRPVFPSWILFLWIRNVIFSIFGTYQKHGFWIGIKKHLDPKPHIWSKH
jgi:hypothetical protein